MRSIFSYLLVFIVLSTSTNVIAQGSPFMGQLKSILAAGELNQFADIRGEVKSTDSEGKKTYHCTLPLQGFYGSFIEVKGKLEFFATAASYTASRNDIVFLSEETVRDMAGLPGYKNTDRPAGDFETVIALMKPGSDVKLVIITLKDKAGYTLITSTFKSK